MNTSCRQPQSTNSPRKPRWVAITASSTLFLLGGVLIGAPVGVLGVIDKTTAGVVCFVFGMIWAASLVRARKERV